MRGETITDTLMKILPKSLSICFLAASILILLLNVDFVGAQDRAAGTAASRRSGDPLLSRYLRFGRLTTEEGLSSDQAWHVAQDNHGFMWFATANGLSRYDGASVKVYRHDPDDPNSLGHNILRAMIVDQSGDLWLGTWGGGLNKYDREKDAFISYQNDPDDPHSLIGGNVDLIYEGRHGMLWIALEAV